MKKFVTLLLTAALAVTAATTAFADDTATQIGPGTDGSPNPSSGRMDVTYTVKPSYTVTIPGLVTLNATTPSKATVKAENVTIPMGQKLEVTLKSDKNFYVKTSEGAVRKYNVTKDNSTTPISNDATVLEVNYGTKSTELTFEIEQKNVTYSGDYTDTVTFTVSVN